MRTRLLLGICFIAVLALNISAQSADTIRLFNPSFEDFPRNSVPPRGWMDCGFPGESPADVQPGSFDVNKVAADGNTYLGMVVRDNETWESVSQPMSATLQAGQCYSFSIFLARSELYISQSRANIDKSANYTTPVKFKIYGGNDYCDRAEVLAETKEIVNFRWLEYHFKFEPKSNCSFITFEVFYKTPTLFPYNGNLLIDNASPIIKIPCSEDQVIAATEPTDTTPETQPKQAPFTQKTSSPPVKKSTPKTTEPKEEKVLEDIKREEIKKGDIIRVQSIYFESGSTDFTKKSYRSLSQLYKFLVENPDIKIEVGGHTNNRPEKEYANWLSEGRAKKVVEYLQNRGIEMDRLSFKGYGKELPIASNKTAEGRKLNQRVEIKIIDLDEK